MWNIIKRYAAMCDLQHINPHDFRRFVGTQLAAQDIRKAQKALGHASIEVTAKHYVLDELEIGLTDPLDLVEVKEMFVSRKMWMCPFYGNNDEEVWL